MKKIYSSPLGSLILIVSHGKLVYVNWDHPDCEKKLKKIESLLPSEPATKQDSKVLESAEKQLEDYFSGVRKTFELPFEFIGATDFQKKVWSQMKHIPFGEVRSYQTLAIECGDVKATRAVANACGKNPLAIIIPCHRIIGSDGRPGGYTGGMEKKILLLRHEE